MVSATFRHLIWYIWWRCQSLVAMKSVVRKNVQDTFAPWAPVWGIHRSPWLWRSYWVDDLGTTMTTGSQSSCKRTNVMTCEDGDGISRNWWQEQAHETCSECFCCMSKLWLPVDVPFKLFSDSIQLCISGFLVTLFSLVNQSIFIVFTSKKWQRLAMVQWVYPLETSRANDAAPWRSRYDLVGYDVWDYYGVQGPGHALGGRFEGALSQFVEAT
jgi:hypothetical protein